MAIQFQDDDQQYEFAAVPKPISQKQKYRPNMEEEEWEQPQDEDIQNPYEELTDIPPDDEANMRADFYIDKPPTPQYKPKAKGINIETQIDPYEPELFDYILEVEPILQVIVGKTIEQARIELIEEEEKLALLQHKQQFEKKRNAELMVTQRMEAAYVRRKEEKERRQFQHSLHQQQLKQTQIKLIARSLSKLALRGVKTRVLEDLENLGYLRDDKMMVLRQHTLPWFINNILNGTSLKVNFEFQFENYLKEMEKQASNEHHKFYKIEQDRRQVILAERERLRIEIEERKQRKIEIKRRWAIKAKRDALKQQIDEQVLSKIESLDTIFNTPIYEGITEKGQHKFYITLQCDLLLTIAQTLDFMVEGELTELDEQMILNIWIDLLTHRVQQSFNLNLSSSLNEFIQTQLQLMEEDPYTFNKQYKHQCIVRLIEQLQNEFWASYMNDLSFRRSSKHFRREIIDKLTYGLFDVYFKSINYKNPEQKDPIEQSQQEPQDQPLDQDPQLVDGKPGDDLPALIQTNVLQHNPDYVDPHHVDNDHEQAHKEERQEKPEVTELDLEMVEAKKKIHIVFKEREQSLPKIDVFVRLYLPFHVPQPPKSKSNISDNVNQSVDKVDANNSIEQIQEEPQEPQKSKWDFDPKSIDIYDGEQEFVREGKCFLNCIIYQLVIQMEEEQGFVYNFGNMNQLQRVLIHDQRANYFARKHIYHILKERYILIDYLPQNRLESFLNIIPFDQFLKKFEIVDKEITNQLQKDVQASHQNVPIFDYEF